MAKKSIVLGKFLQKHRLDAGFTQAHVADKLKYDSAQYVSDWERGVSSPPLRVLPQLAKMYGMSKDELIEVILSETKRVLEAKLKTKSVRPMRRGANAAKN